ncbi:hypothetical protein [Cytobacillus depressus]|uniref:hypothetical protein n=1 Tax=Cytobacillus depressus TaxID=1602942 RepID=UPI00147860EC|nr:hypothetical protein [Cytobacillus depressus]
MVRAETMAKKMAGLSLQALSRIKKAVNEGAEKPFDTAIDLEVDLFGDIFSTDNVR